MATAQDFMLEPALYLVFRSFLRGVMEHITVAIPDSDDDHMKDVARHTQITKRERSPTPPGSIEQELSPDAALDALIACRNQRSDASEVIPTWFDDFSRRLEGKIGSQLALMTDAFRGFQSTVGGLDARLAALEQKQPADNKDPRVDQLIQQVADLQQKLLQEGQPRDLVLQIGTSQLSHHNPSYQLKLLVTLTSVMSLQADGGMILVSQWLKLILGST